MANNTLFRANLVSCLHKAQKLKNTPLCQAWSMALKAYDSKNIDSLNFWIRVGGFEIPEMRQKALTMTPITLDGFERYEKEQLSEQRVGA